jgi:hypothetical protein
MKIVRLLPFLFLSLSLSGQDTQVPDTDTPSSVQTIDGILREMLSTISREKGETKDWDAFRQLFLPTVRFTVLYHGGPFPVSTESVSLEEFIELLQDAYYEEGFSEYELGKSVQEYNGLAQVFQAVAIKDSEGEEARAMNSYQLLFFEDRWWIANVVWTTDDNGVEIPEEYIPKK